MLNIYSQQGIPDIAEGFENPAAMVQDKLTYIVFPYNNIDSLLYLFM